MFAKVFNTARRVLSRSPSAQTPSSEPQEVLAIAHDLDITMVSTRSGADLTPRSESRKGKRGLESGDTPISSKKRRKSVGADDKDNAAVEVEEQIVAEATAQAHTSDNAPASTTREKLPIRRRTNPMVIVNTPNTRSAKATPLASPKEQTGSSTPLSDKKKTRKQNASPVVTAASLDPTIPEETSSSTVVIEVPVVVSQESSKAPTTPKSKMQKAKDRTASTPMDAISSASRLPNETPLSTYESKQTVIPEQEPTPVSSKIAKAVTTPKSSQKSTKVKASLEKKATEEIPSSTFETDQASIHSQEPTPALSLKTGKAHLRFGSEEPADAGPMTIDTQKSLQDDDDSDSDAAPEEITTASAVRQVKAADEEALRAHKILQEKETLKRKERIDRMKQEQGVKQRKAEKKAEKLAKRRAQEELLNAQEEEIDVDIRNLPSLLPDSLLEAAGDTRPPTPPRLLQGRTPQDARQEKINRHVKFLERGEKPIKDVKKGKLSVHVLGKQNMLLAPKVNRNTKNIRETWLKGRQAAKQDMKKKGKKMQFRKVERRNVGGGFLRRDD